jgi:hypothetical protein
MRSASAALAIGGSAFAMDANTAAGKGRVIGLLYQASQECDASYDPQGMSTAGRFQSLASFSGEVTNGARQRRSADGAPLVTKPLRRARSMTDFHYIANRHERRRQAASVEVK